jgi:hypothetical protein
VEDEKKENEEVDFTISPCLKRMEKITCYRKSADCGESSGGRS